MKRAPSASIVLRVASVMSSRGSKQGRSHGRGVLLCHTANGHDERIGIRFANGIDRDRVAPFEVCPIVVHGVRAGTFRTGPAWPVVRDSICPSIGSTPTMPSTIDVFNVSRTLSYAGIAKGWFFRCAHEQGFLLIMFFRPKFDNNCLEH